MVAVRSRIISEHKKQIKDNEAIERIPLPFLTVVIPAYNEEERLPATLVQIDEFLSRQSYTSEIVVVENGSTDDTSGVVERFMQDHAHVRLLHSPQGKGVAVKTGMLAGRGEYLFICDADLSMPIAELSKFLPLPHGKQTQMFDVAIASREIPGSVRHGEPHYRHLMGRIFNLIVRTLALPGIQDSQCGFKCFGRAAAREVFTLQTMHGWGFDVEVLYIARKKGFRLVEVPINWYYRANSRVNPIRDSINMVREVLHVRRNDRLGLYNGAASEGARVPAR